MRKPNESLLQTTEQLKAPQRISLTLLNRAQQIRNSSAVRVEAAQGRLAELNAKNRALNDDAILEGGKDGGIASQAARRNRLCKRKPVRGSRPSSLLHRAIWHST
jgi:hypothetical protein